MENVLIVSCLEKGTEFFFELLRSMGFQQITIVKSGGEARRTLLEKYFDLVLVNAPLKDESGESLSRYIACKEAAQVILVVKSEYFDAVSALCEDDGVLTISKPVNKAVFWSALSLVKAAHKRLKRAHSENAKLKQKIEDIRVIDRAKCVLISYMNLDEQKAHRFIEKQAMDMRTTKREIAEDILKTYDG